MGFMGDIAKLALGKAADVAVAAEALRHTQPSVVNELFFPNKLLVKKKGAFSDRDLLVCGQDGVERYRVNLREKNATSATVSDASGKRVADLTRELTYESGFLGFKTSLKRYVLRRDEGFFKVRTLGRITPDYSQPTATKLDFDFNGWQIRSPFMSGTYDVFGSQGNMVAQIVSTLGDRNPYAIGYANQEDELGVVICLAVLDLHLHTE